MKIASMMLACTFAVAACGGGKKGGDTTTTNTTTTTDTGSAATGSGDAAGGESHPCTHEIALECPEGQIDACLKSPPEGDTHTCVAK